MASTDHGNTIKDLAALRVASALGTPLSTVSGTPASTLEDALYGLLIEDDHDATARESAFYAEYQRVSRATCGTCGQPEGECVYPCDNVNEDGTPVWTPLPEHLARNADTDFLDGDYEPEADTELAHEAEQERQQLMHDEMINDALAEDGRWGW